MTQNIEKYLDTINQLASKSDDSLILDNCPITMGKLENNDELYWRIITDLLFREFVQSLDEDEVPNNYGLHIEEIMGWLFKGLHNQSS